MDEVTLAFEELASAHCIPGSTDDTVYIEVKKGSNAAGCILAAWEALKTEDAQSHLLSETKSP